MLTALFCGLGSVGIRHLKVLRQICEVRVISYRTGKGIKDISNDVGEVIETSSLENALKLNPNFAIISNPTRFHVKTALRVAQAGIPFLIEKPVSDRSDDLNPLTEVVKRHDVATMVGFQLRHHPGYVKTMELINSGAIGQPLHLQGYVGQYLPDWRPGLDYRQSYSASKKLGGGVILDLCHEIDIAMSFLGDVVEVCCMADRISDLDIETEDVADIVLLHQRNTQSSIHLNYLERSYIWSTKITGVEGTILWDYGSGIVELYVASGTTGSWSIPNSYCRDDLFRSQMQLWLDVLAGKATPMVDLIQGIKVTKVALAALASASEKRFINLKADS